MDKESVPIPEPPPGDMAWLWFHPDADWVGGTDVGFRRWHCWTCDVTWKQYWNLHLKENIKCWCCGQFQKHPKV